MRILRRNYSYSLGEIQRNLLFILPSFLIKYLHKSYYFSQTIISYSPIPQTFLLEKVVSSLQIEIMSYCEFLFPYSRFSS